MAHRVDRLSEPDERTGTEEPARIDPQNLEAFALDWTAVH